MANIEVRKDGGQSAAIARKPERHWDPLRYMRDLMSWDPFREMMPYFPEVTAGFTPTFEIKETGNHYIFKADVPGVKEADLSITVTGNRLTIAGKREEERREHSDTLYTYERSYGDFSRSFTLPEGADMNAVTADLKDGVLTVTLKKPPQLQPKRVEIQSASKKS
jgi:HSP20 family protein